MVGRASRTRTRSAGLPARSSTSAVTMSVSEVFHRITSALGGAGIAYMLAGSFASAYYGAPRTTQDIDLVIAATADQLRTFVQFLPKDQYYVDLDAALEARKHQSLFNVVDMATGWKIDMIIRKSPSLQPRRIPPAQTGESAWRPSFCSERRECSRLEARMGETGTVPKADWRIEDVAGILRMRWGFDGSRLSREVDFGVENRGGMERCSARGRSL